MKIRNGFVSNSSSSSFIVSLQRYLRKPEEIRSYLESHDEAVLFSEDIEEYEYGLFIRVDRSIIEGLLNGDYPKFNNYEVALNYSRLGEGAVIKKEMVGNILEVWSGYDGDGEPKEYEPGWYDDCETTKEFFDKFR